MWNIYDKPFHQVCFHTKSDIDSPDLSIDFFKHFCNLYFRPADSIVYIPDKLLRQTDLKPLSELFTFKKKAMKKNYKKIIRMYLGNIDPCSHNQPFKPFALLYTICIREAEWYADSYSIPELEKLLKLIAELPKQKRKTLYSVFVFLMIGRVEVPNIDRPDCY